MPSAPAAAITLRARSRFVPLKSSADDDRYTTSYRAPSGCPAGSGRMSRTSASGLDRGAPLFGQVQVVLDQRVLRVVPAAHHAAAAVDTAAPRRTFPAEVRVGHLLALAIGRAEEGPDRRQLPGVRGAELAGDVAQQDIGRPGARIGRDAEHPAGGVVVGTEQGLPVGQVAPGRCGEHLVPRRHQHVGIAQAAAADARAVQHEDVAEGADLQNPEAAERGGPERLPDVPVGAGKVLVAEALAPLEHMHPVALFGEPKRRDAAAEPGADDDEIKDVGHECLRESLNGPESTPVESYQVAPADSEHTPRFT